MIEKLKRRLVPKKDWGGEEWFEGTPEASLLVKRIFTTANLSIQVHPDDAYARAQGCPRGKTEMWHIVSAQPDSRIAAGFREPVSEERLREAALSGEIVDLLAWHEARPGDTFFIPAGTVHAIGAGLTLWEIQQHSDITYRLYDYGRPRELHLEHALKVANRGSNSARAGAVVSCEYFTTEKLRLDRSQDHKPASRELWVVLEGSGEIDSQPLSAGEVINLTGSGTVPFSGTAEILRVVAHV